MGDSTKSSAAPPKAAGYPGSSAARWSRPSTTSTRSTCSSAASRRARRTASPSPSPATTRGARGSSCVSLMSWDSTRWTPAPWTSRGASSPGPRSTPPTSTPRRRGARWPTRAPSGPRVSVPAHAEADLFPYPLRVHIALNGRLGEWCSW